MSEMQKPGDGGYARWSHEFVPFVPDMVSRSVWPEQARCPCINCAMSYQEELRRRLETEAHVERMRRLNIWPYNRVEE